MKKIFYFFSLLSLLSSLSIAIAHTQIDVDNASYLASRNIITTQSTTAGYRLDDTITRAEVVGIALKVRWVPLPSYRCKGYYTDTRNNDWICRAVEIGADAGLVSRANAKFRPQDKITRAEALAILMKTIVNEFPSPSPGPLDANFVTDVDDSSVWWDMIFYVSAFWIIQNPNFNNSSLARAEQEVPFYFYPNRAATRAEVFAFAKNILEYKATMSGEVTL